MKEKTAAMKQDRPNTPFWLYQDILEDDFLMSKTPQDLDSFWGEED